MSCLVWECLEGIIHQHLLLVLLLLTIAVIIIAHIPPLIDNDKAYKVCEIRRRIRWEFRYSLGIRIALVIASASVFAIISTLILAGACFPSLCPDLGKITITINSTINSTLNSTCLINNCLDKNHTLTFSLSSNNPNVIGWITILLTATIGYIGYKINNSQKKQEETQIMEEVYHNIIEEAKEYWDEFRFSKYITALNRLGYYVYRGTLDPRVIEEQFAMWILRNHKQLIQKYVYLTTDELKCINPDKKDKIGYAKRFYWLLIAISLVYLKDRWNDKLEDIIGNKTDVPIISENCIAPDVETWLKEKCYWPLSEYKIKMQTKEEA